MSSAVPSDRVIERLATEIEEAGRQGLIVEHDAQEIATALRNQASRIFVELIRPTSVSCGYRTKLADLRYLRCTQCKRVINALAGPTDQLVKRPRCPFCKGPVVAAPVWAIYLGGQRRIFTSSGIKILLSVEDYRRVVPQRIRIRSLSRPISNLVFEYPTGPHEPFPTLGRTPGYQYMISLVPSESITKPVSVTAFSYNADDCIRLNTSIGPLNGLEEILYCRNLEILQATIAYRAGHYRTASHSRTIVIDGRRRPTAQTIRLYVRYFTTQGLVIKTDKEVLTENVEALRISPARDPLWIGLHTLSHAFLVRLPQVTGLESEDFGEALSTVHGEFAVFDNSPWGLGGVEGIADLSANMLDPNYEMHIRSAANCSLACVNACKACLFTDSCFMLNWNLDRRIILNLGWSLP